MTFTRREALILAAAGSASTIFAFPAVAQDGQTYDLNALMNPAGGLPDHALGAEDAPVTVIEYLSPTCPHCARFHADVLPAIKQQYIDTGKVRFIMRPFTRNVQDAVVFLVAEAAGPENYHNVLDAYMRSQMTWMQAPSPREALQQVAMQLGFTNESFEQALTNQQLFQGLEAMRNQASEEFDLTGTPTFYINGKMRSGELTIEQFAAEVDPLLAAAGAPA